MSVHPNESGIAADILVKHYKELAVVVNRHRIHRMHKDRLLGWDLAEDILRLEKDKARKGRPD